MTKQQRYAIHYTIIGLIVLIMTITSISTFMKSNDENINYPEMTYVESAKGVITEKYKRGNKYYVKINGNEERVEYSVIQNYSVGDNITLKVEDGVKASHACAIVLMWITILGWVIIAFFAVIEAFDRYFSWLKGNK